MAPARRTFYWQEEDFQVDFPVPDKKPVEKETIDPFKELGFPPKSRLLIHYLPEIYQSEDPGLFREFSMRRPQVKEGEQDPNVLSMQGFLGAFDSILLPVIWTLDNFDLFLDPGSAPGDFLQWLATWFGIVFHPGMPDAQKRTLLKDAHLIYNMLGTSWALSRVLEIYTGITPVIDDQSDDLEPHTFRVRLPFRAEEVNQELIETLVEAYKPAHTGYVLEYE
jgi:phage tail-like protein